MLALYANDGALSFTRQAGAGVKNSSTRVESTCSGVETNPRR